MKEYEEFLYSTARELSEEYRKNESAGSLRCKIKNLPSREFKFTCHLGYEYKIIIENIKIFDYPLRIEDTYISSLIKEVPSYIYGIKYDIILLHNGSGLSKINRFSKTNELYGSLITNFHQLFGETYFNTNFIRDIGQEESEEQ